MSSGIFEHIFKILELINGVVKCLRPRWKVKGETRLGECELNHSCWIVVLVRLEGQNEFIFFAQRHRLFIAGSDILRAKNLEISQGTLLSTGDAKVVTTLLSLGAPTSFLEFDIPKSKRN